MKRSNFICTVSKCNKPAKSRQLCSMHYERARLSGDPLFVAHNKSDHGAPQQFLRVAVIPFVGAKCLIWPYARSDHGYASIRHGDRSVGAHRLVCEAVHGPPPDDKPYALHSCGNGHLGCVNPGHLRWGSATDNSEDMVAHGRAWWVAA